jgi:hypothetical protein
MYLSNRSWDLGAIIWVNKRNIQEEEERDQQQHQQKVKWLIATGCRQKDHHMTDN